MFVSALLGQWLHLACALIWTDHKYMILLLLVNVNLITLKYIRGNLIIDNNIMPRLKYTCLSKCYCGNTKSRVLQLTWQLYQLILIPINLMISQYCFANVIESMDVLTNFLYSNIQQRKQHSGSYNGVSRFRTGYYLFSTE